jgi:hypothetical protein
VEEAVVEAAIVETAAAVGVEAADADATRFAAR